MRTYTVTGDIPEDGKQLAHIVVWELLKDLGCEGLPPASSKKRLDGIWIGEYGEEVRVIDWSEWT